MMIYISCAKTMTARSKQQVPFTTTPAFEADARQNAMHMAQFSAEELARMLRINSRLPVARQSGLACPALIYRYCLQTDCPERFHKG